MVSRPRNALNATTRWCNHTAAGTIPKDGEGDSFKSSIPRVAGGKVEVTYTDINFKAKYIDEYTGETLEPNAIASAIREELNYFNSRVW